MNRHVPLGTVATATVVLLGATLTLLMSHGSAGGSPRTLPTTLAGARAELREVVSSTIKAAGGEWVAPEYGPSQPCRLPSGVDGVTVSVKTGATGSGAPEASAGRVEAAWRGLDTEPTRKNAEGTLVIALHPHAPSDGVNVEFGVNKRGALLLGTTRCVPKAT